MEEVASPLCFLLRPLGGNGRAARTLARLLLLLPSSPRARSHLPGEKGSWGVSEEGVSSTGVLVTLNSDSWKEWRKSRAVFKHLPDRSMSSHNKQGDYE